MLSALCPHKGGMMGEFNTVLLGYKSVFVGKMGQNGNSEQSLRCLQVIEVKVNMKRNIYFDELLFVLFYGD
jgi:hypothetical protein